MVQGLLQQLSQGGTSQIVQGRQGHTLAYLGLGQIQMEKSILWSGLQPNGVFFWMTK